MTIDDEVTLLASLIKEDTDTTMDRAMSWSGTYIDYIRAIKEGRAYMETETGKTSPKYWTNNILFTMRPTIIYGAQGQGKSFFCSWAILRALVVNPDWDFYTNLPYFWFDYPDDLKNTALPNVHLIRNMEEMLMGIIRSRRGGRYPAIILDEMDATVDSYSWQSEESQSWRIFTQFQRHFYVKGPILVYHYAKHIPAYLRVGGMGRVLFLEYNDNKRYIIADFTRPWGMVIDGLTPPYASHGSYPFEVNVDMRFLYRKLEGVNPQRILDKMEEALPDSIITNEKVERKFREIEERKTEEMLEDRVMTMSLEGKSYREISDITGISLGKISMIVREHLNKEMNTQEDDTDKEN